MHQDVDVIMSNGGAEGASDAGDTRAPPSRNKMTIAQCVQSRYGKHFWRGLLWSKGWINLKKDGAQLSVEEFGEFTKICSDLKMSLEREADAFQRIVYSLDRYGWADANNLSMLRVVYWLQKVIEPETASKQLQSDSSQPPLPGGAAEVPESATDEEVFGVARICG